MGAYGSISIIHSAITENTKVLLVKHVPQIFVLYAIMLLLC